MYGFFYSRLHRRVSKYSPVQTDRNLYAHFFFLVYTKVVGYLKVYVRNIDEMSSPKGPRCVEVHSVHVTLVYAVNKQDLRDENGEMRM